jgi:hypothetical protein
MMARELGMRDGFAGGSAVRYMDTRPQQPEIGEQSNKSVGGFVVVLFVESSCVKSWCRCFVVFANDVHALNLYPRIFAANPHACQNMRIRSIASSPTSTELKEVSSSDSEPEYGEA